MSDPSAKTNMKSTGKTPEERTISLRRAYLQEVLRGNRKAALELIMEAYRSGYPIPDIYMDVFQEALYEIGRLWEANQISVADEHMGTAITQYVMSNLYQHLDMNDALLGKAVVTGVEGELHQVGANMVSDILEANGWDVIFLGTDIPPEGVIQSLKQHGADLFCISSTMVFSIPKVIQLVEMVRREFGKSAPAIMLGGGAFRAFSQLPDELAGCSVALNLQEALDLTKHLAKNPQHPGLIVLKEDRTWHRTPIPA
jgi:MerR family transcriptional regulator, light-induced transcriptional regulator